MTKFDAVIIGSGLSGLICAATLAKEGMSVCVLEQHHTPGGCFQNFERDDVVFDTGVHYIGAMDEGQVLNSFFKYFDLNRRVKFRRMDNDCFDKINFEGKEYSYAMGFENFKETLISQFPEEKEAIANYVNKLIEVKSLFPLYNLDTTATQFKETVYFETSAYKYIDSLTQNHTLKNVLAGTNPLYAGVRDKSPLYIHSLVNASFIESSYRIVDGSQQLTDILCEDIKKMGGEVRTNSKAVKLSFSVDELSHAHLESGETIEGKYFIAAVHPNILLDMLDPGAFRKAYRDRIRSLENTTGAFSLYLSMKPESFPYLNYNYYDYGAPDVWRGTEYTKESWPEGYMLVTPASSKSEKWADGVTLMYLMNYEDVAFWKETDIENRGDSYLEFKKEKTEKALNLVEKRFPNIRAGIKNIYSSTPLTYRDYTGTAYGSIYGILKDYKDPLKSFISPKTKIPNLLFTGQNINLHGVVGVTIAAIQTCGDIIGLNYLLNKIKK